MRWFRIAVIGTLALLSLGATAEEKEKCGPYDGVDLTNDPVLLERILSAHKGWLTDSFGKDDPRRANLCRATLAGADLSRANLNNADLSAANLQGADLSEAELDWANMERANLRYAKLAHASLHEAKLWEARLDEANLSGAYLVQAHISEAILWKTNLSDANLGGVELGRAKLRSANLSKADLSAGHMSMADLTGAKLRGADLSRAYMSRANLTEADLSYADLRDVDLTEAKLVQTELADAKVTHARFSGAQYEPTSAPLRGYLTGIQGLRGVWFEKGEQGGLVLLRAALKESGLRQLEREATYAIERGKTSHAPPLERWLKLILFEWTSDYGLDYGRSLLILLALLFPFAVVYSFPLAGGGTSRIYRVWSDERIDDDKPVGNPERHVEPLVIDFKTSPLRVIAFSLYFSLLSAVHIGWRDLNVGNWIARVQPREYTLRAKGWVRTVSGIQSLISIYLLALWVLVYFGRPFE